MAKHVMTIVVGVVIVACLLVYLFFYQVRTNEVAVLLTFGKQAEKPVEAGWHAKWPWPIQDVHCFDNRMHVQDGRPGETYTAEKHNVIVGNLIGWQISDVKRFDLTYGSRKDPIADAWADLEKVVRSSASAVLGQHSLGDLVSTDETKLQYDRIEKLIKDKSNESAMPNYGMQVVLLKVRRLELPETVRKQVYARMKEERARDAQGITKEGETEADVIKNEALAAARKIEEWAKKEAEAIRSEAERERSKYAKLLAQDSDLAVWLRAVRAFKEVAKAKGKSTFILDTNAPPWNILKQMPPRGKMPVGKAAGAGGR